MWLEVWETIILTKFGEEQPPQNGSPPRVDCLAPRRKIAISVFPKDTATRYRIGSRTKVSQPFDYSHGALPTEHPAASTFLKAN